ncbi:MAG: type IV toxin-antitoxin system AbiEi family antitoxin domain-containing protein [Pseudomonadota bacterium]
MKGIELLTRLQEIGKSFYSVADLEKITGLSRPSLYVALKRWVEAGYIEKVGRGLYVPMRSSAGVENIAAQLYVPNYLSFESALSAHGILNLIPYTVTFATRRKTRRYAVRGREVVFRKMAQELFFGYELRDKVLIAYPEKAFLDMVYLVSRGKANIDFDEMDFKLLSLKVLKRASKKFPHYVEERVEKLLMR